jgi:hypothetical protein
MKGNPPAAGGLLTSKPTWLSALWVFNSVGFFILALRRVLPLAIVG